MDTASDQQWRRSAALVQALAGRWTLALIAELVNSGRR